MHRLLLIFTATLTVLTIGLPVTATAQPQHKLTIEQAINAALDNNADVLLAAARSKEAAGKVLQARAAFLPHLSAGIEQSRQQINFAAQGITFPGLPSVNTYNSFHARLKLRQTLFDLSAWNQYQSAQKAREAAAARKAMAREQVAARTAIAYVKALRARKAVEAAKADLSLARHLADLAQHQHEAGFASGVDVARAETRVAHQKARLAQAHTKLVQAKLNLARVTGLLQKQHITLSGELTIQPTDLPSTEKAIQFALDHRAAMTLRRQRLQAKKQTLDAAQTQRWPTVALSGTYGDSGSTINENIEETYRISAQIKIPIFSGGAIAGRIDSATSRTTQARIRLRDTRAQIRKDVQVSLRTLTSTRQQIEAAQANLKLAKRELKLARDRFEAGVTNNVEVTDAQTSLANARAQLVAARAQYAAAFVNFAAARGTAASIDLSHL